jgi:hypothetical protein
LTGLEGLRGKSLGPRRRRRHWDWGLEGTRGSEPEVGWVYRALPLGFCGARRPALIAGEGEGRGEIEL